MSTYAVGSAGVDPAYDIGNGHRTILSVDPAKVFDHTTAIVGAVAPTKMTARRTGAPGIATYTAPAATPTTGQLWPRGNRGT